MRAQDSRGTSSSRGLFDQHSHSSTSSNVTYPHVTESAVLASEIEQLADLQGYLKISLATGVGAGRAAGVTRPSGAGFVTGMLQ